VPEDTPDRTPEAEPIAASDAAPLDHVPPVVVSARVTDWPTQTIGGPVITDGGGNILISWVAVQPGPSEYVIVVIPGVTPQTIPLDMPAVAALLLLLHVPPAVPSVSGIQEPWQTLEPPAIATGGALTVNIAVAAQPVPGA
jgi:hypothetical protein